MDTAIPSDNSNKDSLEVTIFPFFLTPKFFLEEIYEQPSNQFYSKFVSLKNVRSDYLVELVELVRSKHGRMFIITSEIPNQSLSEQLEAYTLTENGDNINNITNLLSLIANALTDLKRFNLIHGLLTPSQIFPSNENLLLAGYWWNKLSEFGLLTEFPICNLEFSSPELIAYYLNKKLTGLNAESLMQLNLPFTYKTDIWSLGSILFLLLTQKSLYNQPEFNASLFKSGLKLFLGDGKTVIGFNNWLDTNLEETRARFADSELIEQVDGLIELTKACLRIDPSERITLEELRSSPTLSNFIQQSSTKQNWQSYPILPSENSKLLESSLTPQQLLHIWKLSGGDINQLVDNKLPPILSLPTIIQNSEDLQSQKNLDPTLLFDQESRIKLDLGKLIKEKVLETGVELCNNEVFEGDGVDNIIGQSIYKESNMGYYNLSQILNQKDFHLNLNRIELFNKLLSQYPSSLEEIKLHSKSLGIPNQLRGPIWACLLQVEYRDLQKYDKINKNLSLGIDKQLQLDITRCQQYNPLLASNLGHSKLFNVLKSWQLSNPDKVYWQGIDSLAGIFLSCNFNDESRALICLENFINKYQIGFFTDNNSSTLWSYLGIFLQLLNFHDPVLTSHLHKLGLGPKAYAINWFYTMFAYVFPLDKLVLLWDRILVSEANYPWLVGLAILNQLRFDILKSEQLGTIPLSTDSFLDIDLELCMSTADNLYHLTPNTLFDIELFKILNPPPQNSWEFPEEIVNLPILNISEWKTVEDRGFIMDLRSKSQFKGRHLKNSFHLDKPAHLLKVVANSLRPYSETQIMGLLCDDKQIGEGFVQGLIRNQFGHLIRITDWDEYYSELIDVSDGNDQNKVNVEWCTCSGKEAFKTQPKYKDNPNVLLRKCVYLTDL